MTKPEHVVNWWGPRGFSTTIETMDFRVGGVWKHVMRGPDGTKYPNKSVFKEIVKPERIVFSHGGGREEGPGASFQATWSFEALAADKTRVTARMVFPSATERDFVVKEFGAIEGGKQTLMRLGEFLAGQQCPPFVIAREFNAPRELVWKAWTRTRADDAVVRAERLHDSRGQDGFPRGRRVPLLHAHARGGQRDVGQMDFPRDCHTGKNPAGEFLCGQGRQPDPSAVSWRVVIADVDGDHLHRTGRAKTTINLKWFPLDAATAEEIKTFDAMRGSFSQGWKGTFDQLEAYLVKV